MSRIRLWALLLLVLTAAACSPAAGDRAPEPSHDGAGHDTIFGSSDFSDFSVEGGYAVSEVIPADHPATRAGFLFDLWPDVGNAAIDVEVRGVRADGSKTDWHPASETWREAPHVVARAELGETVTATQIRLPEQQRRLIENLVYAAITPADNDGDDAPEDGIAKQTQGLSSALTGIVEPRSAWGARAARCSSNDPNKYRMAVHHTYTPTSSSGGYAARIRSIQAYHQDTRGWCDIGYHMLVTADGRVWEGRPVDKGGSHVGGNNSGNVGFSWVGCFHPGACDSISSAQVPTQASIEGAGRAMRAVAQMYGISPTTGTVKGHRDHSGASTSCPGDNLAARIPDLRAIASGSDPGPGPDPNPGTTGTVLGVVWDSSVTSSPTSSGNVRIGDATITADGGATTTSRSSDGFWTLDLSPGTHTLTVSAPGYAPATTTVDVQAGLNTWGSVGLTPQTSGGTDTGTAVGVVWDLSTSSSPSGTRIAGATISVAGGPSTTARAGDAYWSLDLAPGIHTLTVSAPGYQSANVTVEIESNNETWGSVGLSPAAPPGRVMGVVWDLSSSSSPASGTRIGGATVSVNGGPSVSARASDAFWTLSLQPGTHTLTVSAPGYQTATQTVQVESNSDTWGSVGLTPN